MEVSLGDIAATLALLISFYTIYRQRKTDAKTERLNSLLIEREETETVEARSANLSANFVQVSKGSYRFKIFNRGSAIARNVDMAIHEGEELLDVRGKFPYPTLDVHQNIDLLARVHMGSPRRVSVTLTWDDEAGGDSKDITADVF